MTQPKNPNDARVVSVREFVDTSAEPVEVVGSVVKAKKVNEALAKQARAARGKGR